ncbi:MAG: hypothetical protein PHD33_05405 [Atribacterota bacterium]|nr:hypothetical protein [Atribacterota bacterium]
MRKISIWSMYKIVFVFIIIKKIFLNSINIRQLFSQSFILKAVLYDVFTEFAIFIIVSLILMAISGILGNKLFK